MDPNPSYIRPKGSKRLVFNTCSLNQNPTTVEKPARPQRVHEGNLSRNGDKIIATPKKCRIPKRTYSSLMNTKVTTVMTMPKNSTFRPLQTGDVLKPLETPEININSRAEAFPIENQNGD